MVLRLLNYFLYKDYQTKKKIERNMNIFLSAYLLSPAICTTGFFSPRLTCQWWARSSRCTRSPPAPSVSSLPGQGSTAPRAWAAPPGARPGPGPGSRSGQGSSGTRRGTSGGPPSALKRNGRRGGGSVEGKRGNEFKGRFFRNSDERYFHWNPCGDVSRCWLLYFFKQEMIPLLTLKIISQEKNPLGLLLRSELKGCKK